MRPGLRANLLHIRPLLPPRSSQTDATAEFYLQNKQSAILIHERSMPRAKSIINARSVAEPLITPSDDPRSTCLVKRRSCHSRWNIQRVCAYTSVRNNPIAYRGTINPLLKIRPDTDTTGHLHNANLSLPLPHPRAPFLFFRGRWKPPTVQPTLTIRAHLSHSIARWDSLMTGWELDKCTLPPDYARFPRSRGGRRARVSSSSSPHHAAPTWSCAGRRGLQVAHEVGLAGERRVKPGEEKQTRGSYGRSSGRYTTHTLLRTRERPCVPSSATSRGQSGSCS